MLGNNLIGHLIIFFWDKKKMILQLLAINQAL